MFCAHRVLSDVAEFPDVMLRRWDSAAWRGKEVDHLLMVCELEVGQGLALDLLSADACGETVFGHSLVLDLVARVALMVVAVIGVVSASQHRQVRVWTLI